MLKMMLSKIIKEKEPSSKPSLPKRKRVVVNFKEKEEASKILKLGTPQIS